MEDIHKFLNNISFSTQQNHNTQDRSDCAILKILVGTGRTSRLGPLPDQKILDTILSNIRKKMKFGEPIEITSAWGAAKTIEAREQVDLAEYFALIQYLGISEDVKQIYPPGVRYNIFIGDAYYEYIYGESPVLPIYLEKMRLLSSLVGGNIFKVISLKEVHQKNRGLVSQCNENIKILTQYWNDSEAIKEEDWENIDSYRTLCRNGWVGTIPSTTREFYLRRLSKLFPETSSEERISSLIRFFAYGMMVNQEDLFGRRDSSKCTADFCLLRVPPPGMPRNLHINRLRKRIIPSKFTSKTAPPWTIKGALLREGVKYKPILVLSNEDTIDRPTEIVNVELGDSLMMGVEIFK